MKIKTKTKRAATRWFIVCSFDSFYFAVARLHLLSSSIQLLIQSQILAWHRILDVVIGIFILNKNQVSRFVVLFEWSFVCRIFLLCFIFFLFFLLFSISFYSQYMKRARAWRDTFIVYSLLFYFFIIVVMWCVIFFPLLFLRCTINIYIVYTQVFQIENSQRPRRKINKEMKEEAITCRKPDYDHSYPSAGIERII